MTRTEPHSLQRTIALVGLMGAGKSSVGRRLAKHLGVPFVDADEEIETAAQLSVEEIFKLYGEAEFRDVERRVILRLLGEGPMVLATGGGAFMNDTVRAAIKAEACSVWLKADLETLLERTSRRGGRPLLKTADPKQTLEQLIEQRYPVYAEADIVIETGLETLDGTVEAIINALNTKT